PTAGPQLCVDACVRPARLSPRIGEASANQLAEHLADLGRRRKIADRAERIAGRVIVIVAGFHECFDAERPLGLDSIAECALERGHATEAVPAVDSTRTRRFFAVIIR